MIYESLFTFSFTTGNGFQRLRHVSWTRRIDGPCALLSSFYRGHRCFVFRLVIIGRIPFYANLVCHVLLAWTGLFNWCLLSDVFMLGLKGCHGGWGDNGRNYVLNNLEGKHYLIKVLEFVNLNYEETLKLCSVFHIRCF